MIKAIRFNGSSYNQMHVTACTMNTYCCGDHLNILVTAATVEWTAELRPCGLDPFALLINSSSSSLLFLLSVSFWGEFRKLLIICAWIYQQFVKIKQQNASLKQKNNWCTLQPFSFIYFKCVISGYLHEPDHNFSLNKCFELLKNLIGYFVIKLL